jgi:imidazolonepropionase-like amidohydrolase
MGRGHDLGTVEPGKLADLLIVDGDPSVDIGVLSDPGRLEAVIKGGHLVSGPWSRAEGHQPRSG